MALDPLRYSLVFGASNEVVNSYAINYDQFTLPESFPEVFRIDY